MSFANSQEIFRGGQNHLFKKKQEKYINTPILEQFILKKRGNQDLSREL
jgi:hypothetical protein